METKFSNQEIEDAKKVLYSQLAEQIKKAHDAEAIAILEQEKADWLLALINNLGLNGSGKKTFKDNVIELFNDGIPRTSRQLYNEYVKTHPETKIKSFYDFSGRFANIKGDRIKKYVIKENTVDQRYIYGLSEWFEEGNMKKEYLIKKIKADK